MIKRTEGVLRNPVSSMRKKIDAVYSADSVIIQKRAGVISLILSGTFFLIPLIIAVLIAVRGRSAAGHASMLGLNLVIVLGFFLVMKGRYRFAANFLSFVLY